MKVIEKENDDDLMKLIKERFCELPVKSINSIWEILQSIKKEDRLYMVYQVSNKLKEMVTPIRPLVYFHKICGLYIQGYCVFTEHSIPNYKAIKAQKSNDIGQELELDSVKVGENLVKQLINQMRSMDKQIVELVHIIDTRLTAIESEIGIVSVSEKRLN